MTTTDIKLSIREATEADCSSILGFIKGIAEYEKLSHEVTATEETLRKSLFSEDKVAYSLIASYDGEDVGYALYFFNFSTFLGKPGLYLEELFVNPDFRGKGIGKALFDEVAKIAKEKNCGRFEWAVLDWNKPAIDFYEAHGAKPMSEWVIYRLTEDKLQEMS